MYVASYCGAASGRGNMHASVGCRAGYTHPLYKTCGIAVAVAVRLLYLAAWFRPRVVAQEHHGEINKCELGTFLAMLGEPTLPPSDAAAAAATSCRRHFRQNVDVQVRAQCGAGAEAPTCRIVDLMACVDGSAADCTEYSGLVEQCRQVARQISEYTLAHCSQTPHADDTLESSNSNAPSPTPPAPSPPVCNCACWGGTAGFATPIPAGVIGWWPLDSSWCDASGNGHELVKPDGSAAGNGGWGNVATPVSSGGIGPAESAVDMGATALGLTTVESATSLTIEGWTLGEHGGIGGVLFGFGDGSWGVPSLVLSNAWGFLWLAAGSTGDSLK